MLILSRRQNEKVNFPGLGITIEVLRTGQKKVQLGIDAPPEIRVIRDELSWDQDRTDQSNLNRTDADRVREELHNVAIAIRLSQNLMSQGRDAGAEETLDDAIAALSRLENQFNTEMAESIPGAVREPIEAYRVVATQTLSQIVNQWHRSNF